MRWAITAVFLPSILLSTPLPRVAADDGNADNGDEKVLSEANLKIDGPVLLDFFRQRTLSQEEQDKLEATVQRMGHSCYRIRARASADLLRAGRTAVHLLEKARQNRDLEIVSRAERCLHLIQQGHDADLAAAVARVVQRLKSAGAAEVLVNYLPFANDQNVIEAVQSALNALAVRKGKPEAILIQALESKQAVQRGAAAEALARSGLPEPRKAVHKLLKDVEAPVRLQAALALVESRDRAGVPVLISLLAELPQEKAWPAEEALLRLAGEEAPRAALGGDLAADKVRDSWAGWWRDKGAKMDLAKLDLAPKLLGYTLVTLMDNRGGLNGRVIEYGRDWKVRWEIGNLRYPMDAQVLHRDRVLVAEYLDSRVTERDLKGKILWTCRVPAPMACERLPNGHTFIVSRNKILEVDKDGKEVFSKTAPNRIISSAKKLRNGEIVMVDYQGQLTRLDRKGKEIKSFQVGRVYFYGSIDVLPNGRVLIPEYQNNKVVEYDRDGKKVWEVKAQFPSSVSRLPNGHTLIASMFNQKLVELNKDGKVVWEKTLDGRAYRARRR
jgi:hypothetical protein